MHGNKTVNLCGIAQKKKQLPHAFGSEHQFGNNKCIQN